MPKKSTKLPADWHYETALQMVEAVVNELETGELPLAEVFEKFAQAVEQLQQCDQFLKEKQTKAQLLIENLAAESD
jgi:exodeoxyribonuclease VII small subunit